LLTLPYQNKTLGGVWSEENTYHFLKTNNVRGGIEFSDFPIHDGFGVPDGEHVPGKTMHTYLVAYAKHFKLFDLISFDAAVENVSRVDSGEGWNVRLRSGSTSQTRKLVIATGATNVPNRPVLPGADDFDGPIIHSSEVGSQGTKITDNAMVETVAVLGGGKSAYDAVHVAGLAGKQVEWIIRKSGKGPEWIFPARTMGPLKAIRERLPARRFVSFFSPCIWNDGFTWIRHFLHATNFGKKIAQGFWGKLHAATIGDCGMRNHEKTEVLEPEQSPFWSGTCSGIYNFEKDIYEMVKNDQVRVHREDISRLSSHTIKFKSGTLVRADALITATGFSAKPTIHFTPETSHSDLGVPSTSYTQAQSQFWATLNEKADAVIGEKFPRLLAGPFRSPKSDVIQPFNPGMNAEVKYTGFRLYRAIAPPGLTAQGDHSLAFVGMFSNLAGTARMEVQCMWAYAYLNNALTITPNPETVFDETALLAQYAKHRAPYGHGQFFPDLVFDQVPYMDMLLQDLGLRYWRKPNLLYELFSPYTAVDYRGLAQEWMTMKRKEGRRTGEKTRNGDVEGAPLLDGKV
jgi:cation diffusion facilitator CzcD-associated flavoprotein CzcO